ncbi:MAG: hypothetical protein KF835_11600 [Xanthobacteraceae bacterium]|nr:hypothetical protein [Xanthobacteraceae bacterium]
MVTLVDTYFASYLEAAEPSLTYMGSKASQRIEKVVARSFLQPITKAAYFPAITKASYAVQASETDRAFANLETVRSLADDTISQILKLSGLEDDWDGLGAAKAVTSSVEDAKEFVRLLGPKSVMPKAALHADGRVILFIQEAAKYFELEFFGEKRIGFFCRNGEDEWGGEVSFDGRSLPPGLSSTGLTI